MRRPLNRSDGPPATSGRCGFTVLELLVVVTVIGILVAISLPAIGRVRATSQKLRCANNLRNIALALTSFDQVEQRLPASGYISDPVGGSGAFHHTWAVSILPWLEQRPLYDRWNFDLPPNSPTNRPLANTQIPVYVCPMDISQSDQRVGDQSYAVNGGIGFTTRTAAGVGDCAVHWSGQWLDLNGDGLVCTGAASDELDDVQFKRLGLFFLENWNPGGTVRHFTLGDVVDGTTQTLMVTENVRAGFNPEQEFSGFADANPYVCAFYIGNPCPNGKCDQGSVDYRLCNLGNNQINSGLWSPEGSSPVPNSFHDGGVNMAYADGHVSFFNAAIDGAVYAALASPQGMLLDGSSLKQALANDLDQ